LSTIDLDKTNGKGKLEWASAESEIEQLARLKREELDAFEERRIRAWTFMASLSALFIVGGTGLFLIFLGGTPERERIGAMFVTAIASGAVGFLSGKAMKTGK
jgi:hypothetical protein